MKTETNISPADRHALRIARQTMRETCVMARVLGVSHVNASYTIARITGKRTPLPAGCDCPLLLPVEEELR
jgi:hypothetical protein